MTIRNFAILLIVLALAGCTSTPSGEHSAQVGTCSVIDGIDVWKGGPPARTYRVITNVNRTAADSSTSYQQQVESIAAEARRRGADAVIVLNEVMTVSRMDVLTNHPIMAPKVTAQLIQYQ